MKVSEWEKQADYGTHRICSNCGNATVKRKGAYGYGDIFDCSVKNEACGSGSVKPSHSCVHWRIK